MNIFFLEYHMEWRENDSRILKDECDIMTADAERTISGLSPHTTYRIILTAHFTNNTMQEKHIHFTTLEPRKQLQIRICYTNKMYILTLNVILRICM